MPSFYLQVAITAELIVEADDEEAARVLVRKSDMQYLSSDISVPWFEDKVTSCELRKED